MKDFFKNLLKRDGKEENTSAYKAYLATDLTKYKKNEYVVFGSKGVYDHGMQVDKILDRFRKEHPDEVPFVAKVSPKRFITY